MTTTPTTKPKNKGKLISSIICGVIAVAMLLGAILLFAGRAQNRVNFLGNKAMIWIMTGSMQPSIEPQSYIQIEKVDPADIRVGDVITFYSDDPSIAGSLNTHEVIEIQGEGSTREFVTKGTNNAVQDRYTAKADKVVGRYVKNLPTLTVLMRFFMTKAGFAVVLLAVALMTLAVSLPDIIRYFKERSAKQEAEKQALRERLIAEEVERLKQQQSSQDHTDE